MSAVPLCRQPQRAERITSVVIVGSGFAAFQCARRLARRLDRARASDVRVTIVSPVDYMQYSPLLADVAGGLVDPRFVCIPLAGTLKGVRAVLPRLARVAIMYNPDSAPAGGTFFLQPFIESSSKLKIKPATIEVHDQGEIERAMTNLGKESRSGLIVMPDNFTSLHRELVISLAAEFRIPAIYPYRYFAEAGGLLSYGVDAIDLFRRASEYVSRIVRGATPADLPVQAPTKFEFVINLKTAKALGLVIPKILLAGADAVIE